MTIDVNKIANQLHNLEHEVQSIDNYCHSILNCSLDDQDKLDVMKLLIALKHCDLFENK